MNAKPLTSFFLLIILLFSAYAPTDEETSCDISVPVEAEPAKDSYPQSMEEEEAATPR